MWEVRGEPRHFTFSKIMCWVAFDRGDQIGRAIRAGGPVRALARSCADGYAAQILDKAYDRERNTFVQYYGGARSRRLAAADPAARLPAARRPARARHDRGDRARAGQRRFRLPLSDAPRRSTGCRRGEGVFLACSFWLANSLSLIGRRNDAIALFERLLAVRNDLGPAVRGIRSALGTAARQFPAGLLAYRDHQYRGASRRDRKRLGGARRSRGDRARWRVASSETPGAGRGFDARDSR